MSYTPASRSWYLCYESMDVKPLEKSRDPRALTAPLVSVATRLEQLGSYVRVSEARNRVLAAEDRCKEREVLFGRRVKPAVGPAVKVQPACNGGDLGP